MMQNKSSQLGFSLVETLVAITILLIVIVGPLAIVSSAANSTMFASDQVTAFLLAQEGAELAQKARDDLVIAKFNNSSAPDPWATFSNSNSNIASGPVGIYSACYGGGCGLTIGSDSNAGLISVTSCASNIDCQLQHVINSSQRSQFVHNATLSTPSGFTRVVTFENVTADQVRVLSKVTWYSDVTREAREVKVETFLFDVYDL